MNLFDLVAEIAIHLLPGVRKNRSTDETDDYLTDEPFSETQRWKFQRVTIILLTLNCIGALYSGVSMLLGPEGGFVARLLVALGISSLYAMPQVIQRERWAWIFLLVQGVTLTGCIVMYYSTSQNIRWTDLVLFFTGVSLAGLSLMLRRSLKEEIG